MNTRIKQLMPKPWTFPYPDRELYTKEQFEKFAELIVRECMEQVRDEVQYEHDDKLADAVTKRVSKHFGVEE